MSSQPQAEMMPVALFWGLSTCSTIASFSAKTVLASVLALDSAPSTFKVYVNLVDVESDVDIMKFLEELESIGASLVSCRRKRDGTSAIHTFIMVDAFFFAVDNPRGSSIIFVTEGSQLSYATSFLRDRGYGVRIVESTSLLPEPSSDEEASVSESMDKLELYHGGSEGLEMLTSRSETDWSSPYELVIRPETPDVISQDGIEQEVTYISKPIETEPTIEISTSVVSQIRPAIVNHYHHQSYTHQPRRLRQVNSIPRQLQYQSQQKMPKISANGPYSNLVRVLQRNSVSVQSGQTSDSL